MIQRTAIYAGTFDPITNGHLDIIKRGLLICDTLIIAVAQDIVKNPIFTAEERVEMIQNDIDSHNISDKVEVIAFKGLLVEFAKQYNAGLLIRGLRAVSDFEYEFQLANMNTRLSQEVQTIFLPASDTHQFLASSLVKEVARLQGDISSFVSANVANKLQNHYQK